ncbi:hypothetical protein MACK_000198 [Theileria orientalis]|uniref:Small-subunit processome Utp12 domain-containing protein n=1 Tax=Theileria orientalis TaxID=68886 RepID=A0A976MBP3_THEOR|nr:hypothetical protein MACK_000198 [Theileria orientalis]
MWHRGSLTLLCSSCRYVIRKWHIPILGVDCNANPRHKQALSNPTPRSRGVPKHLTPYIFGKQYPRHPTWRGDHTFVATSKFKKRMANKVRFETMEEDMTIESHESQNRGSEKQGKSTGNSQPSGSRSDNTYKSDSDPASVEKDRPRSPTAATQKGDRTPTSPSQKADVLGSSTPKRYDKTFSVALTQALLTSDTKLLHKLLSTKDTASIQDTVSDLTPPLVLALLEFILSCLIKSPNQLYSREGWINSILRVHNSLFTRNNRAKKLLVKLNKYIVGRLAVNKSLLKLKGKVDGLVYMVSMCNRGNATEAAKLGEKSGRVSDSGPGNREALVTFTVD